MTVDHICAHGAQLPGEITHPMNRPAVHVVGAPVQRNDQPVHAFTELCGCHHYVAPRLGAELPDPRRLLPGQPTSLRAAAVARGWLVRLCGAAGRSRAGAATRCGRSGARDLTFAPRYVPCLRTSDSDGTPNQRMPQTAASLRVNCLQCRHYAGLLEHGRRRAVWLAPIERQDPCSVAGSLTPIGRQVRR